MRVVRHHAHQLHAPFNLGIGNNRERIICLHWFHKIAPEERATTSELQVRGDKFASSEALRQISRSTWTAIPPVAENSVPINQLNSASVLSMADEVQFHPEI